MIEGFITTRDRTGTQAIENGLSTYSTDVVMNKFPNFIDGLKTIHRRILWFAKDYQQTIPLSQMLGGIMSVHTSGDQTIVESIIKMSQNFVMDTPFIRIRGKNGMYYDPNGFAAFRYLDAAISEFGYDLFFKGIELKTLPFENSKDFSRMEPRYLIPRLPAALLTSNLTIGIGFKSTTPMLSVGSVCDLVQKYSEQMIAHGMDNAAPEVYGKYLVPEFPIKQLIRNKEELIEEYSKGNFNCPIMLDGFVELAGDNITLRSVAWQKSFDTAVNALRNRLKDRTSKGKELLNYIKTAQSLSADEAEYAIPLVKGRNPFDVLDRIRSLITLRSAMHPAWYFSGNDKKLCEYTPLTILRRWYSERQLSITGALKYKLERLVNEIRATEAILLICDHKQDVIDIMSNANDTNETVAHLKQRFAQEKLTNYQANIIADQKLKVLQKVSKDELQAKLEKAIQEKEEVMTSFGKVNELIYNDVQILKKKYAKPSPTRYSSEFKGYIKYGNLGIIHFYDEDDMYDLLLSKGWGGNVKKEIHLYGSKSDRRYILLGGKIIPMEYPGREVTCEDVICYPNRGYDLSLAVSKNGNTSVIERNVLDAHEGWKVFPISKKFYAIHRSGKISEEDYTDFTIRKTVSHGGKTDIIYALPNSAADLVVLHMNPEEVNIIRIDKILSAGKIGRMITVPVGNTQILGVFNIKSKEIYLNIPNDCTRAINIDHLVIKNIKNLLTSKDNLRFDLNKSSELSKYFKRHTKVRTLYTLDLG